MIRDPRFDEAPRSFTLSGKAIAGGASVIVLGLILALSGKLWENVGPDEIVVIQSPFAGTLTWYTTPGVVWQGFGEVTTYQKRVTADYPPERNGKGELVGGIELRFNDGGHATMFNSTQFQMPMDDVSLNAIHANYRGPEAVKKNLLETVISKSVYLTGTLMSSKESYAEKRNDLIHHITDQIQNGVYRTRQETKYVKDEITNQNKQIVTAEILLDKDNKPERQEESVLNKYNIKAYNFTITSMPYDNAVETQIKQQQQLSMSVAIKAAEARQAEQDALTKEATGRANATEAKWTQETIKARETTKADQEKIVAITNADREKKVAETQAEQRLNVADFERRAAEQTKLQQILLGEGEATRKQLVLKADGALSQKLDAWVAAQKMWADALAKHQGAITPSMVFGGTGQVASGNAVQSFMDIMTAGAATQLKLNMDVTAGTAPK